MKIKLLTSLLFLSLIANLSASTYFAVLDDKHYTG
jgi:hypothetical protein